jgi:glycine/D-amino acid oxidase-like deaminating enzyme
MLAEHSRSTRKGIWVTGWKSLSVQAFIALCVTALTLGATQPCQADCAGKDLFAELVIKTPAELAAIKEVGRSLPFSEGRLFRLSREGVASSRVFGTLQLSNPRVGLSAPPHERRALILAEHAKRLFPDLRHGEPRLWMEFRPSTPDSLPILGTVPSRPRLHLAFGHVHFGMTGGPPSGRLVASLMTGVSPPIDPAPYAVTRFAAL